jgi:DNA mismatch repair protein MutS
MAPNIPQEYGEILKKYQMKYGPQTTVFMQVGSFYELYDIQDPSTGKTLYNVREIADILGLQISVRQDSKTRHDILVAGLPDYALHRWAAKMTSMGWTVVQVDQVKDSSGNVKSRQVTRVISPGTHIEAIGSSEIPYILCIFFESSGGGGLAPPKFALASLDLTTGQTTTFSDTAHGREDIWTADSLQQFLSVFPPREIIIYVSIQNLPLSNLPPTFQEESIRRQFAISQHIPIFIRQPDAHQEMLLSTPLARQERLTKIFSIRSLFSTNPNIPLGLKNILEEKSLILLAQYAEEHISSTFQSFQKNTPWHQSTHLVLGNNALSQLQIVSPQQPNGFATQSTSQINSIVSIFKDAITPMGKRAIRHRIVRPLANPQHILDRLNRLEAFENLPKQIHQSIETRLRFFYDIPRIHRRLQCCTITADDVQHLNQSYSTINSLLQIQELTENPHLRPTFDITTWNNFLETYYKLFKTSSLQSESDIPPSPHDITFLNTDTFQQLKKIEQDIQTTLKDILKIREAIAQAVRVSQESIRIEEREKEPFGLKTSSIIIKAVSDKKVINGLTNITTTNLKSGGWIDCQELSLANIHLQNYRTLLVKKTKEFVLEACTELTEKFMIEIPNILDNVEAWIEEIDCLQCLNKTAMARGWQKPTIVADSEESFLQIQGLRHPIVESSLTRQVYISHNITLSQSNETSRGWLIYGMNASGKSTLMKATGIAVVLAQAGSYVPALSMTLAPFSSIYTRILNHDNIFQGLSSFAVEMSELRDIIQGANKNSLVLGDELCAGTESESAQAIVASGIEWLSKLRAKFLFATHLHEIPKMIDAPSLNVKIWHLHVDYNPITKKLIYDRELRPGSGSSLYGLEVARAMDLPHEFIEMAVRYRRSDIRKSDWSNQIVKRICEICGKSAKSHLEVHHIQERHTATENGILENGQHMNHPRNLIVLCEECHENTHRSAEIPQLIQTSDGLERISHTHSSDSESESCKTSTPSLFISSNSQNTVPSYSPSSLSSSISKKVGKTKWSEEQLQTILRTVKKFPTAAMKVIRFHLKETENIDISEASLSKIKKGVFQI